MNGSVGASPPTQRHAKVAARREPGAHGRGRATAMLAVVLILGVGALGCVTAIPVAVGDTAIDVVDGRGRTGRVGAPGRITVIDVCASWETACNLNARVLDEVARALAGRPVDVVTILLDEGPMGRLAVEGYATTLAVEHPALLAGPRVRAGASALGAVGYVPRLVVVDGRGRVRLDDSGGIVDVQFLVERIEALLREP